LGEFILNASCAALSCPPVRGQRGALPGPVGPPAKYNRGVFATNEGAKMGAPAVRRADFLMALAYATDLATGHSRDFALRSCVLAMRLAKVARLDEQGCRAVYHQALLRYIGCNADTHLLSAAWGDEIALRRDLHRIDIGNKSEFIEVFVRAITRTLAGAPPEELAKAVERGLAGAAQVNIPVLSGHCEVAQRIAERIGLPAEIRENLGQIYERWDGRGLPRGLSGPAVKVPVRLVTLAQDAIALADLHGFEAMTTMISKKIRENNNIYCPLF